MSGADKQVEPEYAVFCGLDVGKSEHHACALDVGKSEHHACALDAAGKRLHDKALPNDEEALAAVYRRLREHGRVLVVVDQPASIGALSIAASTSATSGSRMIRAAVSASGDLEGRVLMGPGSPGVGQGVGSQVRMLR